MLLLTCLVHTCMAWLCQAIRFVGFADLIRIDAIVHSTLEVVKQIVGRSAQDDGADGACRAVLPQHGAVLPAHLCGMQSRLSRLTQRWTAYLYSRASLICQHVIIR